MSKTSTSSGIDRDEFHGEFQRLPVRSVAAAAQLLELWVAGRAICDKRQVEYCLSLLSRLDVDVSDKYDAVFVNEEERDG